MMQITSRLSAGPYTQNDTITASKAFVNQLITKLIKKFIHFITDRILDILNARKGGCLVIFGISVRTNYCFFKED
ncbi:MAG: hypothetical protein C5B59_02285 [Bacteroidetes bacterium]|nr:MAG: hypothetical protein C5B59_02285 [Bacteroidota bacterium]